MYTDIGVLPEFEDSRSTRTKSSTTPEKTRTALAKTAGVSRARISASEPRPTGVNSRVNTKNIATPKISSGITKDRIITKLKPVATGPRQRLMPSANATPSGTAIRVTYTDSRMVCTTAACRSGSCSTEFTGSVKYQRQEKPCQALCDFPLLNENSTASATGTSDQIRYSQAKPSRNHGRRHGLRRSLPPPPRVRAAAAAVTP